MVTMKSTPLDAPLFRMDPERGIEYWGCRAVMAGFTVSGDVGDLVPRGLHLDSPAIGASTSTRTVPIASTSQRVRTPTTLPARRTRRNCENAPRYSTQKATSTTTPTQRHHGLGYLQACVTVGHR